METPDNASWRYELILAKFVRMARKASLASLLNQRVLPSITGINKLITSANRQFIQ